MTDANAKPQPRRTPSNQPTRRAETARRRPLARAGDWTREHWAATRARLAQTRLKRPSRRALYVSGGVVASAAIAVAVLAAIWDWKWFRGPVERIASARMHREVTITGDLDAHLWSWQPWVSVQGVQVAEPGWAGKGRMAQIDRMAVQIRLVPLFTGHVDLRLLEFDRPIVRLYRNANGRANWNFSEETVTAPLRLPPIRKFVIDGGQLRFEDERRKLTFSGSVNATERLGAQNRGFELVGKGVLNAQPFTLSVTGGPLLNIDRAKPYPFDADIRAGATYVTARGAVPKPFDLGHFYMQTTARGPDLADLYGITGVALPNTPPYSLHGRLSREEQLWRVQRLGGRVGSSDLSGELSVTTGRARPLLKGDIRSSSLDFRDLGAIFGGAPKVGAVASPAQLATAQQLAAEQRIFPDATLKVDRIRTMDADVSYRAHSISHAPINLRSGSVHIKLDAGVLRADPLALDLPKGQIAGNVQLDARKAVPVTDLDLRLSNARIEHLIPVTFEGTTPLAGTLVGRAKLRGTGNSVHKAFASSDGVVTVVAPGGEIRRALAELMGVDVTKGLGLLMKKDQSTTPIRCGVASFRTHNGQMAAGDIVFDTGPVIVTGSGAVDLGAERMAFKVQGHPKEFRLVRLMLPVTVSGPIRSPKVGVEPGKAIAQGGVAVALGTLLSPIAAILPFVDPGLAKDANCQALIAEAAQAGAPVRSAAR